MTTDKGRERIAAILRTRSERLANLGRPPISPTGYHWRDNKLVPCDCETQPPVIPLPPQPRHAFPNTAKPLTPDEAGKALQRFYAAARRRETWKRRGWTTLVVLASFGWPVAAFLWAINR